MTVVVTGAAGAIGNACVERFLSEGEDVIAQDLDAAAWSNTAWSDSARVTVVKGNLLSPQCLDQLALAAGGGPLRAAVAAHGVAGSAVLADCTPQFVDRVLTVNASTIPLLYRAVRTRLQAANGAFVAIASQAALIGEAGNTAYCAAKFAVLGWVRAVAQRESDLTLHALCPGATNSQLLITAQQQFAAADGIGVEDYYRERARQIAVNRYGEPREIAAAASYLSSGGRRPVVLAVTGGDVLF